MKAPIKMLFPTVIFIFPAMFIVDPRPRDADDPEGVQVTLETENGFGTGLRSKLERRLQRRAARSSPKLPRPSRSRVRPFPVSAARRRDRRGEPDLRELARDAQRAARLRSTASRSCARRRMPRAARSPSARPSSTLGSDSRPSCRSARQTIERQRRRPRARASRARQAPHGDRLGVRARAGALEPRRVACPRSCRAAERERAEAAAEIAKQLAVARRARAGAASGSAPPRRAPAGSRLAPGVTRERVARTRRRRRRARASASASADTEAASRRGHAWRSRESAVYSRARRGSRRKTAALAEHRTAEPRRALEARGAARRRR